MRYSFLLALLPALLAAPASAQFFDYVFDDGCPFNSDWNCPQNWSTDTVPGGSGANVIIGAFIVTGTFTSSSVGNLTLNGAMLRTSGDLSTGRFNWNGGTVDTDGTLTLTGTGSTWASGSLDLIGESVVRVAPGADVVWTGGTLYLEEEAAIENAGVFDIRDDRFITAFLDVPGAFVNEATGVLRKSTGTVTDAVFGVPIVNEGGLIEVEAGTLRFIAGGTLTDGTYDAALGASLIFDNNPSEQIEVYDVAGTLVGNPAGIVGYAGSGSFLNVDSVFGNGNAHTLDFDGTGFHVFGGGFGNDLTNAGLLRLTSGDSKSLFGGLNVGTIEWDGGDVTSLGFFNCSSFTNEGLFDVQGDLLLDSISAGLCFNNRSGGVLRKSAGMGTASIDADVTNYEGGLIEANAGTLNILQLSDQPGATIAGSATIEPDVDFTPGGISSPGTSPGILTWGGTWSPQPSAVLQAEIGGSTPGTGYDQLAVSGTANVDGTLKLVPRVGVPPQVGDSYTVLTAPSTTGTFDAVAAPTGYTFDVAYFSSSVVVTVLAVPNVDLIAANTTSLTVPQGGAVTFDYSITNNTLAPITGDLFYTATPGNVSGVIINDGTLPGENTVVGVPYTQNVPVNAPPGTYTYTLRVGQFPNTTVDAEAFTVTVVPARLPGGATDWTVSDVTPWDASSATEVAAVPEVFGLASAYPNPFQANTTLALAVPEAGRVTVAVYDVLGRRVAMLLDGEVQAGTHRVLLDSSGLPSGVYLVRAVGAGTPEMQRVTLVR